MSRLYLEKARKVVNEVQRRMLETCLALQAPLTTVPHLTTELEPGNLSEGHLGLTLSCSKPGVTGMSYKNLHR